MNIKRQTNKALYLELRSPLTDSEIQAACADCLMLAFPMTGELHKLISDGWDVGDCSIENETGIYIGLVDDYDDSNIYVEVR